MRRTSERLRFVRWHKAAALALSLAGLGMCASDVPTLTDGVISYGGSGAERKMIDVGRRCTDLWLAPDASVIAFIAIEQADATREDPDGGGSLILRSSVYFARRAEDFAPIRVELGAVTVDGRNWDIFRHPRLSPDARVVFLASQTRLRPTRSWLTKLGGWKVRLCTARSPIVLSGVDVAPARCSFWKGILISTLPQ